MFVIPQKMNSFLQKVLNVIKKNYVELPSGEVPQTFQQK